MADDPFLINISGGWKKYGTAGNDELVGGLVHDVIYGYGGDDRLWGGESVDYLDGGTGADEMHGGAGDDTYVVDNSGDIVDEAMWGSDGNDRVFASIDYTLTANVENLQSRRRRHSGHGQWSRQRDLRQWQRQHYQRRRRQRHAQWRGRR